MAAQRKILSLQTRNIGDAVIGTAQVETLAHAHPDLCIDVLCRPEARSIYENNPAVHSVFTGRFPMGSTGDFKLRDWPTFLALALRLRRECYTDVLNFQGDFREELLAALITRNHSWSPRWEKGHPCARVVRLSPVPLANRPIFIPASQPSIHAAAASIAAAAGDCPPQSPALYAEDQTRLRWQPQPGLIGIHPLASQLCNRWEPAAWRNCAIGLLDRGYRLQIFGAPSDLPYLEKHFGDLAERGLTLSTGSMASFFKALTGVQLLLCHDSFAAHVAYALGTPIFFLNGANNADAVMPPGATLFSAGANLPCYPCYNKPTCVGSAHQYACIRDVTVDSVLRAVLAATQPPVGAGQLTMPRELSPAS